MRSFKLFGEGCVAALKRIKEGCGYGVCKKTKKTDENLHGGSEGGKEWDGMGR
jgi:hypothetical protein